MQVQVLNAPVNLRASELAVLRTKKGKPACSVDGIPVEVLQKSHCLKLLHRIISHVEVFSVLDTMERANDTEVTELIKLVVHNQKRIATSMNALMEIMSTMARGVTPNEPRRAQISPKEDGPHNSRQLQELRGHPDGLEQRVAVLENSRTYSTGDKAHSRDTDARHHLEGTLPEDLSEVLSTWCSLDSIESIRTSGEEERPADPLEQHKGSHFKAVTLAIVFAIRLAASDTPPVNGEERYTPPIEEKTGGDHLKATALAIVFMIKLMKAQELPLVLDSQREIRHPSIAVMP